MSRLSQIALSVVVSAALIWMLASIYIHALGAR